MTRRVEIYKEGSRWRADLYFNTGRVWMAWQYGFKTKARMIENIRCTFDGPIVRVADL